QTCALPILLCLWVVAGTQNGARVDVLPPKIGLRHGGCVAVFCSHLRCEDSCSVCLFGNGCPCGDAGTCVRWWASTRSVGHAQRGGVQRSRCRSSCWWLRGGDGATHTCCIVWPDRCW